MLSSKDRENAERISAFAAMSPEEKIAELERQLKEERQRAANAESELARIKDLHHNDVYHRDSIIENLKMQKKQLEERIRELEGNYAN